jgi:hypothetical protein
MTKPLESFRPAPFFSHSCWNASPSSSNTAVCSEAAPNRSLSCAAFIASRDGCRPPGITITVPVLGVARPLPLPCLGSPMLRRCRLVRRGPVAVALPDVGWLSSPKADVVSCDEPSKGAGDGREDGGTLLGGVVAIETCEYGCRNWDPFRRVASSSLGSGGGGDSEESELNPSSVVGLASSLRTDLSSSS